MPDQVEVKVNLVADGSEQLDKIANSLGAIEKALVKVSPVLTEHEQHLKHLKEEAAETSEGIKKFGESLRQHVETPLGSASMSLGKMAESMGPYGVAIAETAATLTLIGTVAYESMEKLAALGTEVHNISIKTGLSTKEVGQFAFAAKAAGSDIHSFETAMRILSRSLSDNNEEGKKAKKSFAEYGVELRGADGSLRSTGDLFQDIGEKMAGMRTMAERNTFAMNVMGRAGLELVPTLMSLGETLAIAKARGYGLSAEDTERFHEYHLQLLTIETDWARLVRKMEKPIAGVISFVLKQVDESMVDDKQNPGGWKQEAWKSFKGAAIASSGPYGAAAAYMFGALDDNRTDVSGDAAKEQQRKATEKATMAGPLGVASYFKPRTEEDQEKFDHTLKGAEEKYKDAESKSEKARVEYLGAEGGVGHDKTGKILSNTDLKNLWETAEAAASKYKAVVDGIKASEEALKKTAAERVAANKALLLIINAPDMQNLTGGDKYEAEQNKLIAKEKSQGGDQSNVDAALAATRKHADTERVKDRKKAVDEITKLEDAAQKERFSEKGRHILKMSELEIGTPESKALTARDLGLANIETQKQASISEADSKWKVADAAATDNSIDENGVQRSSQQHDEANEARNKSYREAAITFEKERLKLIDQYDEKLGDIGKKQTEALEKSNLELRKMSLDSDTAKGVRDISHGQRVAEATIPLGSGVEGQKAAIASGLNASLAIAKLTKTNAEETARDKYETSVKDGKQAEAELALKESSAALAIKYEKEIYDAREQAGMKLLELAQKQKEEARSMSDSFFDAITGKDPAGGIRDFFMNQAKGVGKSVFSNLTAPIFQGMQSTLDPLKAIGAGKSTPEVAALRSNDAATDRNTAATERNTAARNGGGTGSVGSMRSMSGSLIPGGADGGIDAFDAAANAATSMSGDDSAPALWDFGGGGGTGTGGGSAASSPMAAMANISSKMSSAMTSVSASISKIAAPFGAGAAQVVTGHGLTALAGRMTDADGGEYDATTTERIGAGVGLAAATYTGIKSAVGSFQKGGAGGVIGGIGSLAQTAANFDPEPISHAILQSVAMVSGIVTAIIGDPKAKRADQINKELTNNAYSSTGTIDAKGNFVPGAAPRSISYFGGNGESYDSSFQGGIRGGSFSSTSRNLYDPSSAANQLRSGYLGPPAGAPSDNAIGHGNQAGPTIIVHAMDSKSFLDNAANISAAVRKGIQMGHPVVSEIQQISRA